MCIHSSLTELDAALLQAHAQVKDKTASIDILVGLYYEAFQLTLKKNPTAAYFYLTNAYVYGLDADHTKTGDIEQLLKSANRL